MILHRNKILLAKEERGEKEIEHRMENSWPKLVGSFFFFFNNVIQKCGTFERAHIKED